MHRRQSQIFFARRLHQTPPELRDSRVPQAALQSLRGEQPRLR